MSEPSKGAGGGVSGGCRPGSDPRLRTIPLVRGGVPLVGGPTLDIGQVLDPQGGAPPVIERATARGGPHRALAAAAAAGIELPVELPTSRASRSPSPPPEPVPAETDFQLSAHGVEKSYRKGAVSIGVLKGLDFGLRRGEFTAIVGQSGSGKSTLLHLLGTLDAPDRGEIRFGGCRIDNLPAADRDRLRNVHLGMIFQFYHLLPELSAAENVLVPLMIGQSVWAFVRHRRRWRDRASELLELVGLGHRASHRPRELSGGEMQRVAIARALVADPDVLLADEPTGNLDQATGRDIIRLLRSLNERQGLTIVMVTHDAGIAAEADRTVRLVDGRIAA